MELVVYEDNRPGPKTKLSDEAYETLWERAATQVLRLEDEGADNPPWTLVSQKLNECHPDLYPLTPLRTYSKEYHGEAFKEYLSYRRQQHYLLTMPSRLQVAKYYRAITDKVGNELMERLARDPESFTNKELATMLKDSVSAAASLEKDVKVAAGGEGGHTINLNFFEFLDKLPADRQHVVARSIARQLPKASGS